MRAVVTLMAGILFCLLLSTSGLAKEATEAAAQVLVSLRIPDMITISGLDPIRMEYMPGRGLYIGRDRLCVHRQQSDTYSVVASSWNGGSEQFLLRRGGSRVPYKVTWNGHPLQPGQPVGVRSRMLETQTECAGPGNTELQVIASPEQIEQAEKPGPHTDVLLLRLRAE